MKIQTENFKVAARAWAAGAAAVGGAYFPKAFADLALALTAMGEPEHNPPSSLTGGEDGARRPEYEDMLALVQKAEAAAYAAARPGLPAPRGASLTRLSSLAFVLDWDTDASSVSMLCQWGRWSVEVTGNPERVQAAADAYVRAMIVAHGGNVDSAFSAMKAQDEVAIREAFHRLCAEVNERDPGMTWQALCAFQPYGLKPYQAASPSPCGRNG